MRTSGHLRLMALAVLVWAVFWIGGIPQYYQQYSFTTLLVFTVLLVPLTAFAGFKVIGRARVERRLQLGLWLSFYFTVPFAILDYLYCGLFLGHGWAFLRRFWYLTVYYVIPWLIFVPVGWWLGRSRPGAR